MSWSAESGVEGAVNEVHGAVLRALRDVPGDDTLQRSFSDSKQSPIGSGLPPVNQ